MAVFQNDDKKKDITGVTLGPTNSFGSTSPSALSSANPSNSVDQKPGSGRFTNLQQYLTANKNGGQALSSGIGSNLNKQIDPLKKDSNDYNSKVSEGIKGAQNTLNQGGQDLQQLKTIGTNIQNNTDKPSTNGVVTTSNYNNNADLGINNFTNNPNYNEFKNIQSGNGINENALKLNQQGFANNANNYYNTANTALQNLGSEGGRFQLLKNSFGGNANPNYNVGQQRLDQLFLKQQGVGDFKNQLSQESNAANQLVKNSVQTGRDVGNIATNEQQLIGDINNQAGTNENSYIDMLKSYIPKVNETRNAEYQSLDDAIKNKGKTLTADQIAKLGVTSPTRAYDVFNTLQNASDVSTKGNDAATYGDVADQRNVNEYSALANILGLKDPEKKLTQASQLGNAYTSATGDAALSNRISGREKVFNTLYGDKQANDYVDPSAVANGYGQTLNQFLTGKGTNPGTFINQSQSSYDNMAKGLDKQYLDKINNSGYGNVLTPDGLVNTSEGLDKQVGKGKFSTDSSVNTNGGGSTTQRYNSSLDNNLGNAWQNILDKYNKVNKF